MQVKVQGLKLNNFLDGKFIDIFNDEFEDKMVDAVKIQLAIRDKKRLIFFRIILIWVDYHYPMWILKTSYFTSVSVD